MSEGIEKRIQNGSATHLLVLHGAALLHLDAHQLAANGGLNRPVRAQLLHVADGLRQEKGGEVCT